MIVRKKDVIMKMCKNVQRAVTIRATLLYEFIF
jgi:hypothetical protein